MTKKAEKILIELQKKLDMYVRMYEQELEPYGFCYSCLQETRQGCFELVSHMRSFHLLERENMHMLKWHIIHLTDVHIDKLNSLYTERTGYMR